MTHHHPDDAMPMINVLSQALPLARTDDTAAMSLLLQEAIRHLGASEVRVMVAADQVVETWTMLRGEPVATLSVELDVERPGGMDAWFASAALTDRSIMVSDLPSAPGYEHGLIAVEVPAAQHNALRGRLSETATLVAALVSAARADVERRIAESALFRVRRGA